MDNKEELLDLIAKFMIKMGYDCNLTYDEIYELLDEMVKKRRLFWA